MVLLPQPGNSRLSHKADYNVKWEKRAKRTEVHFRYSVWRDAIGQAGFYICARHRHYCHVIDAFSSPQQLGLIFNERDHVAIYDIWG